MTRRKARNEILVGSFLCLGIGLFLLFLFLMGTLDPLLGRGVSVETDFEDVQGLQAGDPVFLFGMKVGKVTQIRLLPPVAEGRATLRVSFTLPKHCRCYLREDSLVKIDKSLTGNISLVIQETSGRPLPSGGCLKGVQTADLATITERMKAVLGVGEEVLVNLSRIVDEVEADGKLGAAVGEFASIVAQVRQELGPLQGKLNHGLDSLQEILDENRGDLRQIVASMRETSALSRSFSEKLQPIPEKLEKSIEELERAGSAVAEAVSENRSHIDVLLEDLRETSTNAASLSAEIKRRPWRLLYRPTAREEKAMELYDAAWAYNLGATELNRSIRALAGCLGNGSELARDPGRYEQVYQELCQSLRRQKEAEEIFWEKLRASE